MKIYTKTGDSGETSLLGGERVSKGHYRLEAYGTTDELNVLVGALRDHPALNGESGFLVKIQEQLFTIGSHLALSSGTEIALPDLKQEHVDALEKTMDRWSESLPEMKNFILPGGHPAVSAAHVCRVVCRRAERAVIRLDESEGVSEIIKIYLNRLSDLFFVLSRKIAFDLEIKETPWTS